MAIKYEYNSTCCGHSYIETRNAENPPIITKCNICGTGEYQETKQTEIESIPEPIYQAVDEVVVSIRDKFISAGFTEEEINLLIQETIINENDENIQQIDVSQFIVLYKIQRTNYKLQIDTP